MGFGDEQFSEIVSDCQDTGTVTVPVSGSSDYVEPELPTIIISLNLIDYDRWSCERCGIGGFTLANVYDRMMYDHIVTHLVNNERVELVLTD